jgi:hypothetical protein
MPADEKDYHFEVAIEPLWMKAGLDWKGIERYREDIQGNFRG